MSCGKPHAVDCDQILERIYVFIDNELADADCRQIQAHLEECAPCLHFVDVERMVKALVARSCSERAPEELRQRVMFEIHQVQIDLVSGPSDTD
jgi:mycothiol system anti-sigma-R factor